MSYARFGDNSDVYVFAHVGGGFECCACSIGPMVNTIMTKGRKDHILFGAVKACTKCSGVGCKECQMHGSVNIKTRSGMIAHLKKHIKNGDKVPSYAIESLSREIKKEGELNDPYFEDGYDGPVLIDIKTGKVKKVTDLTENKK